MVCSTVDRFIMKPLVSDYVKKKRNIGNFHKLALGPLPMVCLATVGMVYQAFYFEREKLQPEYQKQNVPIDRVINTLCDQLIQQWNECGVCPASRKFILQKLRTMLVGQKSERKKLEKKYFPVYSSGQASLFAKNSEKLFDIAKCTHLKMGKPCTCEDPPEPFDVEFYMDQRY